MDMIAPLLRPRALSRFFLALWLPGAALLLPARANAEDKQNNSQEAAQPPSQSPPQTGSELENKLWEHIRDKWRWYNYVGIGTGHDEEEQALIDRIKEGLKDAGIEDIDLEGLEDALSETIKGVRAAKADDQATRARSNALALLLSAVGRGGRNLPDWIPRTADDRLLANLKGEYQAWKKSGAESQDKSFKAFLAQLGDAEQGPARILKILGPKIGGGVPKPQGDESVLFGEGSGSSPGQARATASEFTAEDLYPSNAQTSDGGKASVRLVSVKEGDWHGAKTSEGLSIVLSADKSDRHGITLSLDPNSHDFKQLLQGKDFLRDDRPEFKERHPGTFFVQLKAASGGGYEVWFGDSRGDAVRVNTLDGLRAWEVERAKERGLVSEINGKKYYVFAQGHSSEGQLVYYDKEAVDAMGGHFRAMTPDHVAVAVRNTDQVQRVAHIGEVDGKWMVLRMEEGASRYGSPVEGKPPDKPLPKLAAAPAGKHESEVEALNKHLPSQWLESGRLRIVHYGGLLALRVSVAAGAEHKTFFMPVHYGAGVTPKEDRAEIREMDGRYILVTETESGGSRLRAYTDLTHLAQNLRLGSDGNLDKEVMQTAQLGAFNLSSNETVEAVKDYALLAHFLESKDVPAGALDALKRQISGGTFQHAQILDGGNKIRAELKINGEIALRGLNYKQGEGWVEDENEGFAAASAAVDGERAGRKKPVKKNEVRYSEEEGPQMSMGEVRAELTKGSWKYKEEDKTVKDLVKAGEDASLFRYTDEKGETRYVLRYAIQTDGTYGKLRVLNLDALSVLPADPASIRIRGIGLPADEDARKRVERLLERRTPVFVGAPKGYTNTASEGIIAVFVGNPELDDSVCRGVIASWGSPKLPSDCLSSPK